MIFLRGAVGMGKTRLLLEVQALAQHQGLQVTQGHGYEDFELPYFPIVEALRTPLQQSDVLHHSAVPIDERHIRQFLRYPSSAASTADADVISRPESYASALLSSICQAIVTLSQHRSMLLILDDLHWADAASVDFIQQLIFTLTDLAAQTRVPFLLIGAYRPEEPAPHLQQMLHSTQHEPICQTLALPGLDETAIRDLLDHLIPAPPAHRLVRTVQALTDGNPLFIKEHVHYLIQNEAISQQGGYMVSTATPAELEMPKQLSGTIGARLQHLTPLCRDLLTLSALLGDYSSPRLLAAVSQLSAEQIHSLLDEATQHHLLSRRHPTVTFAHPMIRQVASHTGGWRHLQQLHLRIANTLERLYLNASTDPDEAQQDEALPSLPETVVQIERRGAALLKVANHLIRAGEAADADRVARYARRAGDYATTQFAWGDAARYYAAALDASTRTASLSLQEHADLHYQAGLACARDQDAGPCLEHFAQAGAVYRALNDPAGVAQALGEHLRASYNLGQIPLGTQADTQPLETALDALGDHQAELKGRLATILAGAYWTARQADRAERIAQQALAIGNALGDDRLRTQASYYLGLVQCQVLHLHQALASWRLALTAAQRLDDVILQGFPLPRLPLVLTVLGRLDEAESLARQALTLTRSTQDWSYHSVALSHLACLALLRGHFEDVGPYTQDTLQMVSRSRYPWGGLRAAFALACSHAQRGDADTAQSVLDRLILSKRIFASPWPIAQLFVRVFRQLLRVQADAAPDEALPSLAAEFNQQASPDTYSLAPYCALVELGDRAGQPDITVQPSRRLAQALERGALFSHGWVFLIPRILGIAATLQQDWPQAEQYFHTAISVAMRSGARPELGRTYLDYARMLAARAQARERPHAIALARQAEHLLQTLGMVSWAQDAQHLRQGLQAIPHSRHAPPMMQPLAHLARQNTRFLG